MTSTPTIAPTPTATPGGPDHLGDPDAAAAADKCQKRIKQAGRRFVEKTRNAIADCAVDLLRCEQTRPGDPLCTADVLEDCNDGLDTIASEQVRLADKIEQKCVKKLTFADLLSDAGLGFNRVASACMSRFGESLSDLDAISRCIADQHRCEAEQMINVENPRAGELMRVAGIPSAVDSCLADNGGSGGDLGDPDGAGDELGKCAAAIESAGARFMSRKLKALQKCVDRVFKCVQTKPLAPASTQCRAKADDDCDGDFAKIAKEETAFAQAIQKKCGLLDFAAVMSPPVGANVSALALECARYDVATVDTLSDYQTCLVRQHECRVEELVRFEVPRANEMLGIVGRSLESGFCPPDDDL